MLSSTGLSGITFTNFTELHHVLLNKNSKLAISTDPDQTPSHDLNPYCLPFKFKNLIPGALSLLQNKRKLVLSEFE